MSDNVKVLLCGAGNMAKEYDRVLRGMEADYAVVGRGKERAKEFERETGTKVAAGGVAGYLGTVEAAAEFAIVAVNVLQLAEVAEQLLKSNVKNILLEKPAGINRTVLERIAALAEEKGSHVYVAYNRRYYASTEKALQIIREDGGVTSFSFEFTEWSHIAGKTSHPQEVKEQWFYCNSTHVCDLAFFLGGFPRELTSYVKGELDWHKKGCIYAGAGISEKGALFSYQANWAAPGRWAVEILTNRHRLYFKPMEELAVQELGSVTVKQVEIEDALDKKYKPGLYRQVEAFLKQIPDERRITIQEQLEHFDIYEQMELKR